MNWRFGTPVFWNPIRFHLSERDFSVGWPYPKKYPNHWAPFTGDENNRLIQATHNRWTHSPATSNHPSTRCSLGHLEGPKIQSPSRIRSKYLISPAIIGWIIIKTLFCKSHDIPNPTIIWFSGTSLKIGMPSVGLILVIRAVTVEWAVKENWQPPYRGPQGTPWFVCVWDRIVSDLQVRHERVILKPVDEKPMVSI